MERVKVATVLTDEEAEKELRELEARISNNEKVAKEIKKNIEKKPGREILILCRACNENDDLYNFWEILNDENFSPSIEMILDNHYQYNLLDSYVVLPGATITDRISLFKFIYLSIKSGISFTYNGDPITVDDLIELTNNGVGSDEEDYLERLNKEIESCN